VLEASVRNLLKLFGLESRRQAALDRIDSLERDGLRIVQELDSLTEELRVLGHTAEKSIAHRRDRAASRASSRPESGRRCAASRFARVLCQIVKSSRRSPLGWVASP